MESFTRESDESSSCTQSDADSTNSSSGTNPFLLCPRGNALQVGGHGRPHDSTEDTRHLKCARLEPPGHHQYHASAVTNSQGITSLPYPHNVIGAIHGSDGLHGSTLLSQGRSYAPSALEDCRGLPQQVAPTARPPHPYLGATQNFFTQDQWTGLRQQAYVLKHVAVSNTPSSALLLPMNYKVDKMPINLGSNSGSFFLGLADPQPGRCRRTDGKKWRCGRAVVPEQKYCERHMHRGRGRSKAAKLAKLTSTVDANQPHNSGRPLNQPLVQLLSQLSVPVQPVSQPLDTVQQPSVPPVQPLKWLQKSTQSLQQMHAHLPHLAQPLLAEPLSQLPIGSKTLDWPINQSPMQAEPLNLVQSNGRPPILAQAIPMNAVTEVKVRPDPANGSMTSETMRIQTTQDPNDVLNLDVQGIKQLLENAPCSMRARNSVNKQKQLPNVADLLNVAHIKNLNNQPRKPPTLMDILKMVDPTTTTSTSISSTASAIHCQLPNALKDSGVILPNNHCQTAVDSLGTRQNGTLLSLACTEEQATEKRSIRSTSNLSGTPLGLLSAQLGEEMMPLKLFKLECEEEDGLNQDKPKAARFRTYTEGECVHSIARDGPKGPLSNLTEGCASDPTSLAGGTSEAADGSQSELHLPAQENRNCFGNLADLKSSRLNAVEEVNASLDEPNKDVIILADEHFKSIEDLKSTTVDINSSTIAGRGVYERHNSLMEQERSSPISRKEAINCQGGSPKSESGSLVIVEEGSLDSCDSSGKSEGCLPSLVEKSLDQHGGSDSPGMISPIPMKKRVDQDESCANIDMNSPVLVVDDVCQQVMAEPGRSSTVSMLPAAKAVFDRSSSDVSSCINATSFPKSTLSLDPVALSNPEQTAQVSLAN